VKEESNSHLKMVVLIDKHLIIKHKELYVNLSGS